MRACSLHNKSRTPNRLLPHSFNVCFLNSIHYVLLKLLPLAASYCPWLYPQIHTSQVQGGVNNCRTVAGLWVHTSERTAKHYRNLSRIKLRFSMQHVMVVNYWVTANALLSLIFRIYTNFTPCFLSNRLFHTVEFHSLRGLRNECAMFTVEPLRPYVETQLGLWCVTSELAYFLPLIKCPRQVSGASLLEHVVAWLSSTEGHRASLKSQNSFRIGIEATIL